MTSRVFLVSLVLEGIFLLTFFITYGLGAWIMFRHTLASEVGRLRRPSTFPFLAGSTMLVLALTVRLSYQSP